MPAADKPDGQENASYTNRFSQFQRTYIATTEENIEKQLFRLKNVPCFGRIVFIEKIK